MATRRFKQADGREMQAHQRMQDLKWKALCGRSGEVPVVEPAIAGPDQETSL